MLVDLDQSDGCHFPDQGDQKSTHDSIVDLQVISWSLFSPLLACSERARPRLGKKESRTMSQNLSQP